MRSQLGRGTAILSRIMKNGYLVRENEVIHDLPTEGLPPVQKNLLDKRMVIPKSSVVIPIWRWPGT